MQSIKVKSPATLSNLCCGFDILGMALNEPYDIIELIKKEETGIRIQHLDAYNLPLDPQQNIAGVALQAMMTALDYKQGFDLIIEKKIKPGSGIGSSAASAAGIVVAANELLGKPFNKQQLISFAMEGEVLASGSRHADNLAPWVVLNPLRNLRTCPLRTGSLKNKPGKVSSPRLAITIKAASPRVLFSTLQ